MEAAEALGAGDEERDDLMSAALCVGEWLAEQGRPGRWGTVDAGAVLELMSLPTEAEAVTLLLSLVGLVGHAAFHEQVATRDAIRILRQIESLATNPHVRLLAAQASEQLLACGG
jgi:hypothetical protein